MERTVIKWSNSGGLLDMRVLSRKATEEKIARALIEMLQACPNLQEGDTITVTVE